MTKVYFRERGLSLGELRITSPEKPYGPLRVGEFPYWQPVSFISPRRVDNRRREPSKCVLADLDFLLIFRASTLCAHQQFGFRPRSQSPRPVRRAGRE